MFSLPVNRQRHIGGLSFFSPRRQEGEAPEYFAIVPEFPAKKHLKKLLPFVILIFYRRKNQIKKLTDSILNVKSRSGALLEFCVHDYYPLCPYLNMLSEDLQLCDNRSETEKGSFQQMGKRCNYPRNDARKCMGNLAKITYQSLPVK